jgi:hypothetical protein
VCLIGKWIVCGIFAMGCVVWTAPAKADSGLELIVRSGYGSGGAKSPVLYEPAGMAQMPQGQVGSIWGGQAKPYGAGFVGDGAVGYRFLRFMSAGVTAGIRTASASSVDDQSKDVSRLAWRAGFYGRGYLPMSVLPLDPWISIGVGYVNDQQTYKKDISLEWLSAPTPVTYKLQHHGIGIPMGLGIDYRVLSFLAIGPSFRYEVVMGAGACMKFDFENKLAIGNSYCSSADSVQRIVSAKTYGVWSFGIEVRLTL